MNHGNPYRDRIVGVDGVVPLPTGKDVVYTNLDNAASTPPLVAAKREADLFLEWYSSIHRGAGFKSQLASEWYEEARDEVFTFLNADPDYHCVILTTNTTDSINRLARHLPYDNDSVVVISHLEHHANDLPWRERGGMVRIPVSDRGEIDPDDLDRILKQQGKRVRMVSLTGASNVVGTIQPYHEFARICHRHGVPIAIDAAQLAPHVAIDMQGEDEESRIDFLFLSGHKMYAPFGGGVLVGPREFFECGSPAWRGGGAVLVVEPDGIDWAMPPDREEAGSPNVLGAVTLAAAMRELRSIGFDTLEEHEQELTLRFLDGLQSLDGATIYGLNDAKDIHRRLGVVAFNLAGLNHQFVASVLANEAGIGVRNGCFCAHPFVLQMLQVTEDVAGAMRTQMRNGDHSNVPGALRASLGLYNTNEEVDYTLDVLEDIIEGKITLAYAELRESGKYIPEENKQDFRKILHEYRKNNAS